MTPTKDCGSTEVGVTAIMCKLAGHPPILMTTQADTSPRPVTCGCGRKHY